VKNVLHFRNPFRVTVAAAVVFAAALGVGCATIQPAANGDPAGENPLLAMNQPAANGDPTGENKLLTRFGCPKELVESILEKRTAFSEGSERIKQIIDALPLLTFRAYDSSSLDADRVININYVYVDDHSPPVGYSLDPYLDPFPGAIEENNALLLFASVKDLARVNMSFYDDYPYDDKPRELSYVASYEMSDIIECFGDIDPPNMELADLYDALGANLQLSEFYFAHSSRIYLGADVADVSYRNGDPNEIISQRDGSSIWWYGELGEGLLQHASGDAEVIPGTASVYYFDSPSAEQNDGLTGLYATMFLRNGEENYENLVVYFGEPALVKDLDGGLTYVAYPLKDGQRRNAYFILQNNVIIADGVMYGDDYAALLSAPPFFLAKSNYGSVVDPVTTPVKTLSSAYYCSNFPADAGDSVFNIAYIDNALSIAAVHDASQHKNDYFGDYAKQGVYTSKRMKVEQGFYSIDLSVDADTDDPETKMIVMVCASRDGEIWSDSVEVEDAAAHITFKSTSLSEEPYHYVFYQIIVVAYDEEDESLIREVKMDFSAEASRS
jgi:hypothetical protein